ncbi:hypothetical protein B0H14DRAFT_2614912 [Mycena olivaceomarginata]|nr:hypothetical protein B0H14DRAFT_2614912 [Mycena olivaceomarginata]
MLALRSGVLGSCLMWQGEERVMHEGVEVMKGEMRTTKIAMKDERTGEKGRQDEDFHPGTCRVGGITLNMGVIVNKLEAIRTIRHVGGGRRERLDEATGRDGGEGEDGREGSDAKNTASSWRQWSSASLAALLVRRIGVRASAVRALRWARKWGDRCLSLAVKWVGAEVGNDLMLDVVRAGGGSGYSRGLIQQGPGGVGSMNTARSWVWV